MYVSLSYNSTQCQAQIICKYVYRNMVYDSFIKGCLRFYGIKGILLFMPLITCVQELILLSEEVNCNKYM